MTHRASRRPQHPGRTAPRSPSPCYEHMPTKTTPEARRLATRRPHATIYTLTDPETGEHRYVGATTTPLNHRLNRHVYLSRQRDRDGETLAELDRWILDLDARGLRPDIAPAVDAGGYAFVDEQLALDHFRKANAAAGHAEILNVRAAGGGRRVNPPPFSVEEEDVMGVLSDCDVAEMYRNRTARSCSPRTVRLHRESLGRPAFVRPTVEFTDEQVALMGTVPDRVVAEAAGCARNTVGDHRRALGIPAYERGNGQAEADRQDARDDVEAARGQLNDSVARLEAQLDERLAGTGDGPTGDGAEMTEDEAVGLAVARIAERLFPDEDKDTPARTPAEDRLAARLIGRLVNRFRSTGNGAAGIGGGSDQ